MVQLLSGLGRKVRHALLELFEANREKCHSLANIIMQLAGNAGAFFFLRVDQATTQFSKRHFCQLPFRNIDARANIATECAIGSKPWHAIVDKPPIFSIEALQSVLHLKIGASIKSLRVNVETSFQVVGMHPGGPSFSQLFLRRSAGEVQPTL